MEDRYLSRGKRIDNGEWVVGAFIEGFGDCDFIHTKCGKYGVPDLIGVNTSTICQCTGLKDKNGKLIFENDIMEGYIDEDFPEEVSRFKVEWNGSGWVEKHQSDVGTVFLDDFDTEHFEVVGNVFDNLELLEV